MQGVPVLGGVNTADSVVGAHDGRYLAILDQHLEGQQVELTQHVLVHFDAGAEALVLLVVDHIVLAHRNDVVCLDRLGDRDTHHTGQVGIFGEVLEVAACDRGAVQADRRSLQHVLAQRRGLRADHVAILVGDPRVEGCGDPDGHGQRGGWRAGGAVAHTDADRAVGDAEPGDTQLVNCGHVPFKPDLGGELLHLLAVIDRIAHRVDVDCLHAAVQLCDLLLQGHGGHEKFGPLARGFRGVKPRLSFEIQHADLL